MAATEDDILRDEQERGNLLRAIADVETALAVSTPGTRRVLENTLENAKKRIVTLDRRIEDNKAEFEAEKQAKIATANLVEKEKALNASERETYGGFLKEAFFTKKDFGKLEGFYAHSWNRLSEGGKDEMSHRVWEGVRHGEYRFTDLPKDVRDKEEDRLYAKFNDPSRKPDSLERIPEADRVDFVHAYKSGNRMESAKVLERESFRKNAGVETSLPKHHQTADTQPKSSDDKIAASAAATTTDSQTKISATSAITKVDVDSLELNGIKLADASSPPSAATMPDASGSRINAR